MSVFFDSHDNLRAGWRLAVFVAVLIPVWFATGIALRMISEVVYGPGNPLHKLALNALISLVAALFATVFAARIVEHAPLQVFGIGFHKVWKEQLGAGLILAGGLMILLMLGTRLFGETHFVWTAAQFTPGQLALTTGLLIVAAAFEELVFRGYPLQVLIKGIGPWPAMIAMSCVFGLMHAQNPNSSRLGVFNTIVAGMILSLAYFRTRSLLFPYGIHLGWNVILGMVVGFPLSGIGVASIWETHVAGPQWLLGGEYGPEGGVLGTLVFLAGIIAVWKYPIKTIQHDDRLYKNSRAG